MFLGKLVSRSLAGRLSTQGTWKLHVMQAGLLGICRVEVVQKGLGSRRQLLKDLGSRSGCQIKYRMCR